MNDRILIDPNIAFGKPVIAGTWISVEQILDLLVGGWNLQQILDGYSELKKEDVIASIEYAKNSLANQHLLSISNHNTAHEASR